MTAVLGVGGPALAVAPQDTVGALPAHATDTVLVGFHQSVSDDQRAAVHASVGGHELSPIGSTGVVLSRVPAGSDVSAAIAAYRAMPAVAFAEPNWISRISRMPSDPRFGDQWGLHNTGQSFAGGTPDADIDAPEGWAAAFGPGVYPRTGGTRVGVIDTGIDRTHPDLAGKVAMCATAQANTGLVLSGTCSDDHGHGTHVAGTIAAVTDNGLGVAGVAPNADLAIFKALSAPGTGFYSDLVAGIQWLRMQGGARIINMSLGGPRSAALDQELAAAAAAGVLLVAAAGNDGDASANYPASHPDVVSVSAADSSGRHAGFSTCNSDVEVAAPGVAIVSTSLANGYSVLSGTSMAAPHVAGAAAVVMSATGGSSAAARTAVTAGPVSEACLGVPVLNLARALGAPAADPSSQSSGASTTPAPSAVPTSTSSPTPPSAPPSTAPTPSTGPSPTSDPTTSPRPTTTPSPAGSPSSMPSPSAQSSVDAGGFTSIAPQRLVDTRTGLGSARVPLRGGESRDIVVTGRSDGPPPGVTAVAVNVTAVGASHSTHLTAFPAGGQVPTASTLNVSAGRTVAALAVVQVSDSGAITMYNQAGLVDLLVDVVGYFSVGGGDGFAPLAGSRLLDTRVEGGPLGSFGRRSLQIAGRGDVPSEGVRAVAVNVTVTEPTRAGHLTVQPGSAGHTGTSSLNFVAGETRANLVVVALDDVGQVEILNSAGSSQVIVDVLGWWGSGASGRMTPLAPVRLHDSRVEGGPLTAGVVREIDVAGRAGVPSDAIGVVVTLTATQASAPTHVSVSAAGVASRTSTLNLGPARTVANLAFVPLSASGRIAVRTSAGSGHVVLDVVGFLRG